MRVAFSIAALVATAFAKDSQPDPKFNPIYKPSENEVVPAGQPYTIIWDTPTHKDDLINLVLLGGPDSNSLSLIPGPAGRIATEIPNSQKSFTWLVDGTLGEHTFYGIKAELANAIDTFQYSQKFKIAGGKKPEGKPTEGKPADGMPSYGKPADGKTIILSSTSLPASGGLTTSMPAYPAVTTAAIKAIDCSTNSTAKIPKATSLVPASAPPAVRNSTLPSNKNGNSSIPISPTSGSAALSASLVSVFGGLIAVVLAL
ncbi:hypothetical protein CDD80_2912 [Ophiocordyceps camponoti-rufipedis]|uniref:Yeast cell wall synthesis Kre9/Knh1-like N-terminal domain-containing protein n=1 Tax=Ophiocordyceps camponoti-rufipedis TaxID=2004952 RepID=A0A2C5ZJT3_9HYPO|nr:hypothetical protein CDD80_2912 [Ophiocordyceps camponoti-rufipedis]